MFLRAAIHLLFFLWPLSSKTQSVKSLNGNNWTLKNPSKAITISATVPGQVHLDLQRAKVIGDPYFGSNGYNLQWISNDTWVYSSSPLSLLLDASKSLSTYLIFDGLDTFATIEVCGKLIGKTNNQFRQYTFDISTIFQNCTTSSNISVTFQPASQAAAMAAAALSNSTCASNACLAVTYEIPNVSYIRKKQSDFGTDSGPAFSPAGIWKSVRAVQLAKPAIYVQNTLVDVYRQGQVNNLPPSQSHPWVVNASVEYIGSLPSNASMSIKIFNQTSLLTVASQSPTTLQSNGSVNRIIQYLQLAEQPNLWWPVGYGNQTIYSIEITIKDLQGTTIANVTKVIGFRTIVLDQRPITSLETASGIANGSKWNFEINGHEIYCKGSNFVPPDAFWPRVTRDQIQNLFESVVDSNQNMIRIWGGGVYLPEWMLTMADNMGIMLWHEFQFSLASYPITADFLANVRAEADYQVRLANSHPSTALWSGGNELELNIVDNVIKAGASAVVPVIPYYEGLYNVLLRAVFDSSRSVSFLPSSATNGYLSYNYSSTTPILERYLNTTPGAITRDTDYYNYTASVAFDSSTFPIGRFAVEFGYESMPSLQTWEAYAPKSDLFFNSTTVLNHNHHYAPGSTPSSLKPDAGNQTLLSLSGMGEMTTAAQQYYPTPPINDSSIANFTSWIYTTQVFQSDFVRAQASFYRIGSSKPERHLGTLYWQLNDVWAAPTWAGIEYSGRWKMLHYTVKDIFKPVIITHSLNSSTGILEVFVVSDLWNSLNGTSTITWYDWSGKRLNTSSASIRVGPINATRAFEINVGKTGFNLSDAVAKLEVEATSGGKAFTHESWFHAPNLKEQPITNPKLKLQYEPSTGSFTVTGHGGLAAYVWLDHPAGVNGNFDDNGFWLLPGQPKVVGFKVKNDKTGGQWTKSVTIRSLWDNTQ